MKIKSLKWKNSLSMKLNYYYFVNILSQDDKILKILIHKIYILSIIIIIIIIINVSNCFSVLVFANLPIKIK